jgi:hypothetical protein
MAGFRLFPAAEEASANPVSGTLKTAASWLDDARRQAQEKGNEQTA